eukprot:TRINITY_DN28046_c0_g1_i1.p1 TRINITY_DN28046_c0_g1~~TRINITY_DN28046_c0_g1_i1.p1  ORF type:complete len:115 (+),score=0.92 TRINITY_DN28046_c0_g1_i1:116-460(+)
MKLVLGPGIILSYTVDNVDFKGLWCLLTSTYCVTGRERLANQGCTSIFFRDTQLPKSVCCNITSLNSVLSYGRLCMGLWIYSHLHAVGGPTPHEIIGWVCRCSVKIVTFITIVF